MGSRDPPWVLARGADAARKHEIKLLGFCHFVFRIRVGNFVLSTELS